MKCYDCKKPIAAGVALVWGVQHCCQTCFLKQLKKKSPSSTSCCGTELPYNLLCGQLSPQGDGSRVYCDKCRRQQ